MEIMKEFWSSAIALDAKATDLAENKRFPYCTQEKLMELVASAGFGSIESIPIEVPAIFQDFADFWHPFTLGVGPAPGYCMSLEESDRKKLHDHLKAKLPSDVDGNISLNLRAWAVKAKLNPNG